MYVMYQGDPWKEGLEHFGVTAGRDEALTERERAVLQHLSHGLLTPEIAAELATSAEAVRSHLENAMEKLGARTRAHAVALAAARGQIALVSEVVMPIPAADASHSPDARQTQGT